MRRHRSWLAGKMAVLVAALALVLLVPAIGPWSTASAAASASAPIPDTLGVVFINGLGSTAPQAFNNAIEADSSDALWYFYGRTKTAGYRSFMVATKPGVTVPAPLLIDSKGSVTKNGEVLGNYLREIKRTLGITDVVLVGHSMGGVIARQFIEQRYSASDPTVPRIVKLVTIGTPHSGWHPGPTSPPLVELLQWLKILPSGQGFDDLSASAMQDFNRHASTKTSNTQVEYVLAGGDFTPKFPGFGGGDVAVLWNSVWGGLENDGAVSLSSALGYEISTNGFHDAYQGPSIFGPDRIVTRVPFPGKYHTISGASVLYALGVDVDNALTLNDEVYESVVAPALRKTAASLAGSAPTSGTPATGAATATAFVFDVSGSMSELSVSQTKIEEARSAGLDVIGSISNLSATSGTAAQVAIAAFSDEASGVQDLTTDYTAARQGIGKLEPLDMTNLGAGLEAGLDQLDGAATGAIKTLILLSDGMANEGLGSEEIMTGPVQRAKTAGVKIYTVGFGDPSTTLENYGLDEDLLGRIARETGGEYARADTQKARQSLSSLFIKSQVASTQKVLAEFEGTVAQGALAAAGAFSVQDSDLLVQVVLNWPGSQLDLQLTDPAGAAVGAGYPGFTLYAGRPAQAIVQDPMAGQWQLGVYGKEVTGSAEPYYALVSSQGPAAPTGGSASTSGNSTAWLWLIGVAVLGVIAWLVWSQRRPQPAVAGGASGPALTGLELPADVSSPSGWHLAAADGTRFELKQGANSVGRASESNIVVDDPRASRNHAVIVLEGSEALVRDLGGPSGTRVNGETVKGERALRDGDRLTFGESTFTFMS